jgi:hypothetical protein
MCQPNFTYSNASIQVISKLGKQQLISNTNVKKNPPHCIRIWSKQQKRRKMLIKSLDKMYMTNLEIKEKQLVYYKQQDMKQI